jgi:exopolyphosphatase/guanosine-5'-triphosphate,3'-diphosphate pyrophosphatase
MNVAVVDVGANTIRLLVAEQLADGLRAVRQSKARVGLGAEVEANGRISSAKIAEAAATVESFTSEARMLGCSRVEVIVASPGRQAANAGKLVRALATAARAPVRVLSRDEEALLAYDGATHRAPPRPGAVAVCDVGGGSTQVVIGTDAGPVWMRSVDIGSLRLTTRMLAADQPSKQEVVAARAEVERLFAGFSSPLPGSALAVGGSARAIRTGCGPVLGEDELRFAVRLLRKRSPGEVSASFGIDPERVRTMTAGALILSEVQRRLAVPLEVVSEGLREGLALALLSEASAA